MLQDYFATRGQGPSNQPNDVLYQEDCYGYELNKTDSNHHESRAPCYRMVQEKEKVLTMTRQGQNKSYSHILCKISQSPCCHGEEIQLFFHYFSQKRKERSP